MDIAHALRRLLLTGELALAVPVAYLCLVAGAALIATFRRDWVRQRGRAAGGGTRLDAATAPRFAVLVPAHNEELLIGRLLASLEHLDYPQVRYDVHVIADNCTDDTASIVRATGWAWLYERRDHVRRGKGFALQDMLRRLDTAGQSYDAYVVVDADSVVEPGYLRYLAAEMAHGARALQGCNTVLNTLDAPSTVLRWVALTLMNHIRPLGRNALRASATLTGNGMCLTRDVLFAHPWQAYGATEDYQYYLTLVKAGERVRYVPEAVVRSEMPISFGQMHTQDVRWESPSPEQHVWRDAWDLVSGAVRHRDLARLEAALELLAPPLSPLAASAAACAVAGVALGSPLLAAIGMALIAGVVAYAGSALVVLRPPRAAYVALLHAPRFIAWKLWVLLALRSKSGKSGAWVRTSRATPAAPR